MKPQESNTRPKANFFGIFLIWHMLACDGG